MGFMVVHEETGGSGGVNAVIDLTGSDEEPSGAWEGEGLTLYLDSGCNTTLPWVEVAGEVHGQDWISSEVESQMAEENWYRRWRSRDQKHRCFCLYRRNRTWDW